MNEHMDQACAVGAAQLITTGLGLQPGQDVLIVCDETTQEVALLLADATLDIGAVPGLFLVPLRQQGGAHLGAALKGAITPCTAILNVLAAGQETLAFRRALLDSAVSHERVTAHMPGATLAVLAAAGIDDPEIDRRNEALARGLALGRRLRVITRGPASREYCLELDLGGWARTPILSGRTISRGTWGNLPGGETYIAPVSGDGELLVDGSIDSILLGEPLVVSFRDGRMVDFAPRGTPGGEFLSELAAQCTEAGRPDWNCLVELGIGTNGSVRNLTTTAMLNEKVLGTCHVALGDNNTRGGEGDANTQVQLVCRAPSILIDGIAWLDQGRHVYDPRDSGEDYSVAEPHGEVQHWRVERTGYPAEIDRNRLYREWYNAANKRHRFSVGNQRTARLAAQVYGKLQSRGEQSVIDLTLRTGMDLVLIGQVLSIMERYQLVEVRP